MPRVAQIDPQSIRDFFAGFGGQFDQGKIDWLCNYVEGRKIPLSSEGPQDGAQASAAISKEMTAICHQLMQILFVPDREEGAKSETGLNISMLKAFLKKRLPEMVPASNAVNSVSDLDKKTPMGAVNAVEAYEPREASGKILPTAARDFHWSGTRLDFQVDVTNVEPGSYTMLGIVKDQQLGRDVGDAGEPIVGALPFKATDPEVGRVPFTIEVPETSKSEGASGGRRYVSASLELPNRDLGQWVQDMEGDGDARYVVISADIGGNMHIAASQRRNLRRKK